MRAPVSTSTWDDLDTFWDEVSSASQRTVQFRPTSRLTAGLHARAPHVIGGDFNAQPYEDHDAEDSSLTVGRYRPPCRHHIDDYVHDKIASLDDWVHADSFRAPNGNRNRCAWYSSIHRQFYEIDWILLQRRRLARLV